MSGEEPAAEPAATAATAGALRAGVFVFDLVSGRCLHAPPAWARLLGPGASACESPLSLEARAATICADDRERYLAAMDRARREQEAYTLTYRLMRPGLAPLELEETGEPWLDPESGALRLICWVKKGPASEQVVEDRGSDVLRSPGVPHSAVSELRAAKDAAEAAEREALEASERFLAAAGSLPDGLAIYDADARLVYHNARYPELSPPAYRAVLRIGARFEDMIRAAAAQGGMYHPDMGADFVERRLAGQRAPAEDRTFRIADGRWVQVREAAIPSGGRVLLTRDITEAMAARAELEEREQRLRTVADGVPLPIVIARVSQPEILFANAYAEEIFGLRVGPEPEGPLSVYLRPEDRRTLTERLTLEGRVDGFEAQLRLRDGGTMWALVSARPLGIGGQLAMLTVVTDISDRRAMEQALRESEQRFRAVVDVQGEFIIRQRPDGMLTFVNDAFCRFRGMTHEQMLGGYNDLMALPPPAQEEVLRQWASLSPERPTTTYDLALDEPDGSMRWEQWTDTAIFDAERRLVEYQSVGRDITEQKLAERALRESEERLRTIAEGVPLPVAIARTDVPEILFANARAIEAFGLGTGPQPEVIARTWVRPVDRSVLLERLEVSGRVDNYDAELRRADGSTLWALVSARAMRFDGKPAMFTAIADISEQKAMEEALRASEARLAAFMDHAPVGMYVKDRERRYVIANPEMAKVFGRPVAEMLGRTAADSPATHDIDFVERSDKEVLETGRALVVEEYTPDLDAYRWDMVIRFPIRGAQGQITHIGGFDVDIADRKRAEQQLRESEQRFRVLAEVHPVPLVIVGVENATIIFASPACAAMFDVPLSRLIGHSILSFYNDPADRQVIMARVRREGGLKDYEVMMRRGDGTPFWSAFTSRLITFEGKEAVVAAYADLTEKKRAEAELERQREALLQNEKMSALGSLLTSVAHELNNPLSVVVGQATILEELSGGSPEAARAAKIRAAADRCARIVKTFLAMARSKAPERREVQVNEVIRAALEIAAYGLNSTGAQIELQLAPDLPQLWADGDQLHQVFANLIINAKQAMESVAGPRRLTIRSWLERDAIMIEVADTGPGIAPEMADRIFEPFFTTKAQGVGTGIGLSVSRRIVAAHGGEISVASPKEGGARFLLRLPPAKHPPAASAEEAPHPVAPAASARVLVVDDEPEIGDVLAEILRLDGFLVDVAAGGRDAISHLAQAAYDLVISDLRMPDLDGPALYRELERSWPHLTRRIVFVTGDTLSVDTSEFIAASGAPVIEKPFDAQRIRQFAAEQIARIRKAAPPPDGPA